MHITWLQSTSQTHLLKGPTQQLCSSVAFLLWGGGLCWQLPISYTSLCLSVRLSNWMLCVAVTKSLVAIFAVYDRPNCHHLIPQHIIILFKIKFYANRYSHIAISRMARGRGSVVVGRCWASWSIAHFRSWWASHKLHRKQHREKLGQWHLLWSFLLEGILSWQ